MQGFYIYTYHILSYLYALPFSSVSLLYIFYIIYLYPIAYISVPQTCVLKRYNAFSQDTQDFLRVSGLPSWTLDHTHYFPDWERVPELSQGDQALSLSLSQRAFSGLPSTPPTCQF